MPSQTSVEPPRKVAERLNALIEGMHDRTISQDPFSWEHADAEKRSRALAAIAETLTAFRYISRTATVVKLVLLGVLLPLGGIGILFFLDMPAEETARMIIWGALAACAVGFGIAAAIIGSTPSVDADLTMALYTVPRGWSFSRMNGQGTWEAWRSRFPYFDQGDESRRIGLRIWGYMDAEKKIPFQTYQFHWDEVYYVSVPIHDSKGNIIGWRQEKHTRPHTRYGMFVAMPESKTRFRISELEGGGKFGKEVRTEYKALNEAVVISCDPNDELPVRQFLSPRVQEIVAALSTDLSGMLLDFYPGFVHIVCENSLFSEFGSFRLDEHAGRFAKFAEPAIEKIEASRIYIDERLRQIRKYNDNY